MESLEFGGEFFETKHSHGLNAVLLVRMSIAGSADGRVKFTFQNRQLDFSKKPDNLWWVVRNCR